MVMMRGPFYHSFVCDGDPRQCRACVRAGRRSF
jgi:hypothetical protein